MRPGNKRKSSKPGLSLLESGKKREDEVDYDSRGAGWVLARTSTYCHNDLMPTFNRAALQRAGLAGWRY
jgi:hypothetical protein